MKRSSRLRALAILLSIAAVAAGCGSKDAPTPPAEEPKPARATGAPRIANSADGVHIEYRVYGAGDPAVVLVHGWSCDSNYWREQIGPLSERYTVVTVDLAGHGASGRNRTEWSIGNFGEDVAAAVRQIENRRIVLVGHSMGGPVALEAVRRIGDRVIGVIGVDTFRSIGQPIMSERELQMRMKAFRADFIGQTREFVSRAMFTKDADPLFVRKVADDMALAPPEVAIPSMEAIARMDFAPVLAELHVPLVAINSDLGGPTDEERIRKSAPTFKAIVLPNTGHFLMMEAPDRFNPVLLQEIEAMVNGTNG